MVWVFFFGWFYVLDSGDYWLGSFLEGMVGWDEQFLSLMV